MTNSVTLLVVDDDDVARFSYVRMARKIRTSEVTLLEAETGQDALDILTSHPVDIVILDYSLPGIDGIETLRRLRRVYPTMPVYILSGMDIGKIDGPAREAQATAVLSKEDIGPDFLERLISSLLTS